MATFTFTPSNTSRLNREPRVLMVQYGDGYSQRTSDGLNANLRKWELVFRNIPDATAVSINSFLETEAGITAFDWTAPGDSSRKWICRQWSRTYIDSGINDFAAVFEEVPG
jgi:phage-related protein